MTKPDFIVVGAPKCGTTAIHQYFREHPNGFVPREKEPHFFCDIGVKESRSEEEYARLFEKAESPKRIGEVSIFYLYSERSAHAIKDYCGDIDIVAMIRNPVDAMYSLHSQWLYNGDEHIESFEEALEAEHDRRNGKRVSSLAWKGPECLLYRDICSYSSQLKRYFDVFGRDRVHVIVFDDWSQNTPAAFAETLRFLDVEPQLEKVNFEKANSNKRVRSKFMRDLFLKYSHSIRAVARSIVSRTSTRKRLRRIFIDGYRRLYTKYEKRPPMDPVLERQLKKEFEPEVRRLSRLLDRDLTHWVNR